MTHSNKSHFWPVIFILALFSICIFIIGIQYGKSVANTDAAIAYIKSLQTSKKPTPTMQANIGYIKYVNDVCGVEFIYPSTMKISTKDTKVDFIENDRFITMFCSSQGDESINIDVKYSTVEVSLKEASNSAKLGKFINNNTDDVLMFTIIHPTSKKPITIFTSKEFEELIAGSIKFTTPQ